MIFIDKTFFCFNSSTRISRTAILIFSAPDEKLITNCRHGFLFGTSSSVLESYWVEILRSICICKILCNISRPTTNSLSNGNTSQGHSLRGLNMWNDHQSIELVKSFRKHQLQVSNSVSSYQDIANQVEGVKYHSCGAHPIIYW